MRQERTPPGKHASRGSHDAAETAAQERAGRDSGGADRLVARRGDVDADQVAAQRDKVRAAAVSIVSNTVLVVFKLIVGLLSGSISILSEAAHSASDLVAAIIAFFSVRAAGKPADERHPYGHYKVENVSGTVEALLIFAAAVVIIYEGILKLIHGVTIDHLWLGVAVMAVSAVANFAVSQGILYPVARRTESAALEADAAHLRTDVYTSIGVAFGLVMVRVTGQTWLDPVFAIAVALLILSTAYRLITGSVRVLLDEALPDDELRLIRECVKEHRGDIIVGYHRLRARRAGSRRHIDLHITVDQGLSVVEAHEVAEHITADIRACLPNVDVLVHVEPAAPERRDEP